MKKVIFLAIRNVNLILLVILILALFLVSKTTCTYQVLQIALGVDLLIQGSSILWSPDLFLYFLSIGTAYPIDLPSWMDYNLPTKIRFAIFSLFILFFGYASLYGAFTTLRQMGCF